MWSERAGPAQEGRMEERTGWAPFCLFLSASGPSPGHGFQFQPFVRHNSNRSSGLDVFPGTAEPSGAPNVLSARLPGPGHCPFILRIVTHKAFTTPISDFRVCRPSPGPSHTLSLQGSDCGHCSLAWDCLLPFPKAPAQGRHQENPNP